MPRFRLTALVLTIAFISLAAIACSPLGKKSPTPTATSATTPPSDETPSETPFAGGRDPVERPAGDLPAGQPKLVDVRAAEHEGFDRFVLEFDAAEPGFRVEYVDEALGCGSGLPATIQGAAFLQVKVQPAVAHDDTGAPSFAQHEIMPGLPSILEAEETCDFEADVTWAIGLTEEADFTAVSLLDPFRVVVDVAHPGEPQPSTQP